jgi:tRNA pseudouridine38-40 synthase
MEQDDSLLMSQVSRQRGDRRETNDERSAKRQKTEADGKASVLPGAFPAEEVAAEERKPKHKVAVCIGYSGTGYRGMQINTTEKTIEGDLFTAFVAAGAISKANADDPKKSQLVRCARYARPSDSVQIANKSQDR